MSDEQTQMTETLPKKTSSFISILLVLLIIIIGFFGIVGFIKWQQLNQQLYDLKEMMKREMLVQKEQLKPYQDKLSQLESTETALKNSIQHQEEILSSWKGAASGNIDKWYIAEAKYLVNLAQLEANASNHYLLINGYLEKAESILQQVNDPKAIEMRALIKQDQTQVLSKATTNDMANIFQQLSALDKAIDSLPLPLQKLAPVNPVTSEIKQETWWRRGLSESWQTLKEMVVIKKTNNNKPFILPDEKIFLQANLHLQLQHAIDGLLRNQAAIYSESLDQAINWVNQYYKIDDPKTKEWLAQIKALKQIDLSTNKLEVSHAIPLFDAYLNQNQ